MIKNPYISAGIFFYIILNIVSLTYFPSMHSDEGWLASLSRSILIEHNIGASEDFFHEVNRNPHAIKSLFHLIQIPFISIRYSLFIVRLLSLIAGLITLGFLFKSSLIIFNDKLMALGFITLIAMDIQFIYISHFARQEIFVLMIFSICLYIFIKPVGLWKFRKDLLMGGILGFSIGIHPNVFIIATGFIFIYLLHSIINFKSKNPKYPAMVNLGLFIAVLVLFGIFYIGLSIKLNPDFLRTYIDSGQGVGVSKPIIIKLLKLPRFFKKMFSQIGGTYYLPNIRPQLIVFSISFLSLIPVMFIKPKKKILILGMQFLMVGIISGTLIIGKYSPPSIIFIFIPGYLLLFLLLKTIIHSRKKIIIFSIILIVSSSIFSINQILPWSKYDYTKYIQNFKNTIPPNARVIGNLNTIFAFSPKKLYSFRDLTILDEEFTFRDYIKKHKLDYIIYSDELEIIFNERPVWNTMYGNIYPWYKEMMQFIKTDCEEIYSWDEPVFGMRITSYMNKRCGNISIYRILDTE